ncbi:hypothetical protein ACOSQ3_000723 [Xanthoceras sorbifolium]
MDDLVGYRFRPSDEEIISYYLSRKLRGLDFPVHVIKEVDINKFEPWDLPEFSAIESDDQMWYFFSEPAYMDAKRTRIYRKTEAGFWKVTGKDRPVKDKRGREIGLKKNLVFHKGRFPNGVGTNWVIHEFHFKDANKLYSRPFVLCRLKKKSDKKSDVPDESSPHLASNSGNSTAVNIDPQVSHELSVDLESLLNDDELDYNSLPALQFLPQTAQGPSRSNSKEFDYALEALWSQLDTSEQEDYFLNSVLVSDEDEHLHEETVQTRLHDFRPVEPLSGVIVAGSSDSKPDTPRYQYVADSSDSDVETTNEQWGNVRTTPSLVAKGQSQGIYSIQATKELQMSSGGGSYKKGEAKGQASSSREKILRTAEISGKTSPKFFAQSLFFAQSDGYNGSRKKSAFIFWETPPSSYKQDPPSVYIVNIFVTLTLLVFFVRELVSVH